MDPQAVGRGHFTWAKSLGAVRAYHAAAGVDGFSESVQ
jgi:hypothetical protein